MGKKAINRFLMPVLRGRGWLLLLFLIAGTVIAQEAPATRGEQTWFIVQNAEGQLGIRAVGEENPSIPLHRPDSGTPLTSLVAAAFNPVDNHIYAFTRADGLQLLRIAPDGSSAAMPGPAQQISNSQPAFGAFDEQGIYYVLEKEAARLFRLNLHEGTIRVIPLQRSITTAGLAWHDGRLYGLDENGRLFSIEPGSARQTEGTGVAVMPLPDTASAQAMQGFFSATNGIFAYSANGAVYRYNPDTGLPALFARWPAVGAASVIHNPSAEVAGGDQRRGEWSRRLRPDTRPLAGGDIRLRVPTANLILDLRKLKNGYRRGGEVGYELIVENAGKIPVQGALLRLPIPDDVRGIRWTCRALLGKCGRTSGSGAIALLVNLEVGGRIFITLTQSVTDTATGVITTSASVAMPEDQVDPAMANNRDAVTVGPRVGTTLGACSSNPFLHQGAGTTVMMTVNTDTNPFTTTSVGSSANVEYNAVGYNSADGFLYGISTSNYLLRINSDGTSSQVGAFPIVPAANWAAGAFASDGYLYVTTSGAAQNVFRIDVTLTNPVEQLFFDTTQVTKPGDIAFYNGMMYTVDTDTNELRSFPVVGQGNAATLPVTVIGNTTLSAPVTAMWGASNGLFGASEDGNYYRFDTATGQAMLISTSAPVSSVSDGAHCIDAPFPLYSDLSITKTANLALYQPGQPVTYTITATNNGPTDVENADISDPLPAGITDASWTCFGSNGATCGSSSGSGDLSDNPDLPVFGSVTYTYTVTIPADFSGDIVNTATVAPPDGIEDPNPDNNSATNTLQSQPMVIVEKISLGGVGTFGIDVNNLGGSANITTTEEGVPVAAPPFFVVNVGQQVGIHETMPQYWLLTDVNCTGLVSPDDLQVDYPNSDITIAGTSTQPGARVECTLTNTFSQPLVTIEKISLGGTGTFGFNMQNTSSSPTITTVEEGVAVQAPPAGVINPGQQVTIQESTIAPDFTLTDISCSGLSTGGIATVNLATNTVTIDGAGTQLGADITCTFTNEIAQTETDLAVTKAAAPNPVTSGDTVTYTITVDNLGPLDTTNSVLTDTPSAGQDCVTPASISCSAFGGAQCPAAPIDITDLFGTGLVIPSLPANSEVVFTVECTVTATGLP